MAIHKYYLSSPRMTVQVNTRDGIIVWAAPVVGKFTLQPLTNPVRWMRPDVIKELDAR